MPTAKHVPSLVGESPGDGHDIIAEGELRSLITSSAQK